MCSGSLVRGDFSSSLSGRTMSLSANFLAVFREVDCTGKIANTSLIEAKRVLCRYVVLDLPQIDSLLAHLGVLK